VNSPMPLYPGLMCCICFAAITTETCAVDIYGVKWDVCRGQCARDAGCIERGGKDRDD